MSRESKHLRTKINIDQLHEKTTVSEEIPGLQSKPDPARSGVPDHLAIWEAHSFDANKLTQIVGQEEPEKWSKPESCSWLVCKNCETLYKNRGGHKNCLGIGKALLTGAESSASLSCHVKSFWTQSRNPRPKTSASFVLIKHVYVQVTALSSESSDFVLTSCFRSTRVPARATSHSMHSTTKGFLWQSMDRFPCSALQNPSRTPTDALQPSGHPPTGIWMGRNWPQQTQLQTHSDTSKHNFHPFSSIFHTFQSVSIPLVMGSAQRP